MDANATDLFQRFLSQLRCALRLQLAVELVGEGYKLQVHGGESSVISRFLGKPRNWVIVPL